MSVDHKDSPNPKYRFEQPELAFQTRILWQIAGVLSEDSCTDDILLAQAVCERNPLALERIQKMMGRLAIVSVPPVEQFGLKYDALEIGGFGYQRFNRIEKNIGTIDPSDTIRLPTSENFAVTHPNITTTTVIKQGKVTQICDPFSFTGAYTMAQIAKKIAANMYLLNHLQEQEALYPFTVPIPIAIGLYPHLFDPQGKNACFAVWRVPYQGERTGYIRTEIYRQAVVSVLKSSHRVIRAIRYWHDVLGLTHNQLVAGNYYDDGADRPLYMADFETVQPLDKFNPRLARAGELTHYIEATHNMITTYSNINDHRLDVLTSNLIRFVVGTYIGRNVDFESEEIPTVEIIQLLLKDAAKKGLIPGKSIIPNAFKEILSLQSEIMKQLKTA